MQFTPCNRPSILFPGPESSPVVDAYAANPNVTFDNMFKGNYWAGKLRLPEEGKETPYYAPKKEGWLKDLGWYNGRS